jgi:hypothetical protein
MSSRMPSPSTFKIGGRSGAKMIGGRSGAKMIGGRSGA